MFQRHRSYKIFILYGRFKTVPNLSKINFDKFRFICKLVTNLDGKTPITTKLIKEYLTQFIMEAVENWLVNKMDSFYVSENLIVSVSSYGGKHYLSISPRMDFLKA